MAQNLIVCRSGQSTGIDKVATAVIGSNTNSFNIFWNTSSNSIVVNLNLELSGLTRAYALTVTHVGFEMYRYNVQPSLYNGFYTHESTLLVDSTRPFIENQQTYSLCGVMSKEVKYVCMEEMQLSPENLLIAKIDIESNVEQKQTLVEFISSLNMTKVYAYKKQMISFGYKEGNQSNYIFYMPLQNTGQNESTQKIQEEALSKFKKKMEDIGYDLSRLSKKSSFEIIETGIDILEFGEYFIIDNEFYI